jgi:hypothetical protein
MLGDLSINAQPLGCHAPLQAGHPVITPRQVEAKASQTRRSEVTGSSAYADDDDAVHGNGLALAPMRIGMALFRTLALAQQARRRRQTRRRGRETLQLMRRWTL